MQLTWYVVNIYAVLTVVGDLIVILILLLLLQEIITRKKSKLGGWLSRHALLLMLIIALLASVGSLFLSEIAGWTPCRDCWFQRIFMYPQVILLTLALWRRDKGIAFSILLLSLIGIIFSIEHYREQVQAVLHPSVSTVPCDTSGASCAKAEFFKFGYITIPMMAMTAFALNILGSVFAIRHRKV